MHYIWSGGERGLKKRPHYIRRGEERGLGEMPHYIRRGEERGLGKRPHYIRRGGEGGQKIKGGVMSIYEKWGEDYVCHISSSKGQRVPLPSPK